MSAEIRLCRQSWTLGYEIEVAPLEGGQASLTTGTVSR
jgi:hypothetical protein